MSATPLMTIKDWEIDQGSFSIALTGTNDAPVAQANLDLFNIDEDGERQITASELLAIASDVDNSDTLSSTLNYSGNNGVLETTQEGWKFTPNPDFNGFETFEITFSDGTTTTTATASLSINPINDKPALVGGEITDHLILEDADPFLVFSSNIQFSPGPITALDESNQSLFYELEFKQDSALGTFKVEGEDLPIEQGRALTLDEVKATKFHPALNANGNIAYTLIVSDDLGQSIYIDKNISVTAVNDVPITENGRLVTVIEDSGISDAGFDINYSSGGGEDEANQEIRIAFDVSELRAFNASGFGGKLVRINGSQSIDIASDHLSSDAIVFLTCRTSKRNSLRY